MGPPGCTELDGFKHLIRRVHNTPYGTIWYGMTNKRILQMIGVYIGKTNRQPFWRPSGSNVTWGRGKNWWRRHRNLWQAKIFSLDVGAQKFILPNRVAAPACSDCPKIWPHNIRPSLRQTLGVNINGGASSSRARLETINNTHCRKQSLQLARSIKVQRIWNKKWEGKWPIIWE